MNLKKKLRRFFTLSPRANAGFTLVELIVVIAILAILAGIGVPAYSGYVTKANQQADMTLASEVAQALTLNYYRGNGEGSGYVVLGDSASADAFGEAAMVVAFGENWRDVVDLKYDGWTDGGTLAYILNNSETAASIADSSYLKYSSAGELSDAVSGVANVISSMATTAENDPLSTLKTLSLLTDEQASTIANQLTAIDSNLVWSSEVGADNSAYSAALSNALVNYATTEIASMANYTGEDAQEVSGLSQLAMQYALVYAWGSSDETGAETLATLNQAINAENASAAGIVNVFATLDSSEGSDLYKYMSGEQGTADYAALPSIMQAVTDIAGNYDMTTPNLYASNEVADQINNYVGSVSAVAEMTDDEVEDLKDAIENGGVTLFITSDGSVYAAPANILLTN